MGTIVVWETQVAFHAPTPPPILLTVPTHYCVCSLSGWWYRHCCGKDHCRSNYGWEDIRICWVWLKVVRSLPPPLSSSLPPFFSSLVAFIHSPSHLYSQSEELPSVGPRPVYLPGDVQNVQHVQPTKVALPLCCFHVRAEPIHTLYDQGHTHKSK